MYNIFYKIETPEDYLILQERLDKFTHWVTNVGLFQLEFQF